MGIKECAEMLSREINARTGWASCVIQVTKNNEMLTEISMKETADDRVAPTFPVTSELVDKISEPSDIAMAAINMIKAAKEAPAKEAPAEEM